MIHTRWLAVNGSCSTVTHGNKPGHDVGDNSCFWKPAKIIRVYEREGEYMADVIFDGDDGESRGHFIDRFRKIETRGND